jgi:preprotein translocase subunit SecD
VKVGTTDAEAIPSLRRLLGRSGRLEFRLVHEKSEELVQAGTVPPGYVVLKEQRRQPDGSKRTMAYLVKEKSERGLTGKYVKRAFVFRNQVSNQPAINFELNGEGAKLFGEVTEANMDRQLAIVFDGVLYSAPVIRSPILGGRGVIEGDFELKEAFGVGRPAGKRRGGAAEDRRGKELLSACPHDCRARPAPVPEVSG